MRALLAIALFVFACAKPEATRETWQSMTAEEKTIYVRSLMGAEKVKERKEGKIRKPTREAEEYVREIDAAYARGDTRAPDQIFDASK
jgi:hypothetical protein